MSELEGQHVRSRRPHATTSGPPVPPKPYTQERTSSQKRGIASKHSKPLPPVPPVTHSGGPIPSEAISKPLPGPPSTLSLRNTLLWIAAFCLWFLLTVVLLPVITEKDAMPGFNRWLREWFS
ncbi:hypothetical protein BKA66DRAFT_477292 [Pyrenochaeta sp. MPI-SDFR-AT-0127]|nr:hypothetical protein BKA66DRAFT_477292 [Pyrenochaeta sp. MPI-SDFR-AT-0127]